MLRALCSTNPEHRAKALLIFIARELSCEAFRGYSLSSLSDSQWNKTWTCQDLAALWIMKMGSLLCNKSYCFNNNQQSLLCPGVQQLILIELSCFCCSSASKFILNSQCAKTLGKEKASWVLCWDAGKKNKQKKGTEESWMSCETAKFMLQVRT